MKLAIRMMDVAEKCNAYDLQTSEVYTSIS